MEVYEITGNVSGVSREGVNFLQPSDSYQNLQDGFIYRQVLQSRKGIATFAPRLADNSRIFGIFEHILPDSTKESLVFDRNFLYKYDDTMGVYNQIPFGGSMAAYAGFAISANNFYVSGTSYPTGTNTGRFVFTGQGIAANSNGSSIFFYDGTNVLDYTDVADNPDYVAPAMGALTRSFYVTYFAERINFIRPIIGAVEYSQGMLYSGIRNVAGNGDNFNVSGSGLLQADTSQDITGFQILGQIIALNLRSSNWAIEKRSDVFNPYFIRKIPSAEGTDALFSSTQWNDRDFSIGKTGIITTEGRTSLRTDNKIPYFTSDEIDQVDFDLTYGGYDRINNQFVWSYKQEDTDTTTQNKVLCYNYEEETWNIYDLRLTCFGQTDLGLNISYDNITEAINPSWAMMDTTEEIYDKIGLGKAVLKTLAGDDLGFVYDFNVDYEDYYAQITAITQASQAVLTVAESAFQAGDEVIIENVEGMTEINNSSSNIYTIVSCTTTSITLNVDSSLFSAYTTGGSISKVIAFRAETIPFNPYREQGCKVIVSHVEFLIDTNGGYLSVDVIADESETPFKQDILLIPSPSSTKAREWITMTVNQEADFITFVMKQKSVSAQLRLTSMRIHCSMGGYTSG